MINFRNRECVVHFWFFPSDYIMANPFGMINFKNREYVVHFWFNPSDYVMVNPSSDPHRLAKLTEEQGSLLCKERQGFKRLKTSRKT